MFRRARAKACPIYDMPLSVVDDILAHVAWPFDVRALTLVSKAFNRCATPVLYSTIVVTHDCPAATLEMLEMLICRPDVAAMVRALVLDQTVSELYSSGANQSALAAALVRLRSGRLSASDAVRYSPRMPSFTVPPKALRTVARLLCQVVPTLPNLQEISLRAVHPSLITECHWSTYLTRKDRWMHKVKKTLRLTTQSLHDSGTRPYWSFYTTNQTSPDWNFWQAVTQHPKRNNLRRLSVVLLDKSSLHTSRPFSSLHVLHIAVNTCTGYISDSWDLFLGELKRVDTLCITGYYGRNRGRWSSGCFVRLLRCFDMTGLRELQICMFVLSSHEMQALQRFVAMHAETLQVLALMVLPLRWSGSDDIAPLPFLNFHPDTGAKLTYSRLHTLRLAAVEQVRCFGCMFRAVGEPYAHARPSASELLAHLELTRFINGNPGIVDLALACLHDGPTLCAIQKACTERPMRRMLVGAAFDAELRRCVGEKRRDWRSAVEHWMYYEVMFRGLELERPEYGSTLAASPHSRLAQRHGH
ncbi:hypothetical protein EXIGLDRAFT_725873 [Exidia glandulosa HHB12029]|uniref:F-box domain-containing protein n=1 Tax=Exidia glandulosa HHB12029 TaxID=1314781 RepID=A0A165MGU0_EXIGL|nr:hypothetical protein EXIGLDRAFT_725873 [Exidia glandulosa HHB12029]